MGTKKDVAKMQRLSNILDFEGITREVEPDYPSVLESLGGNLNEVEIMLLYKKNSEPLAYWQVLGYKAFGYLEKNIDFSKIHWHQEYFLVSCHDDIILGVTKLDALAAVSVASCLPRAKWSRPRPQEIIDLGR